MEILGTSHEEAPDLGLRGVGVAVEAVPEGEGGSDLPDRPCATKAGKGGGETLDDLGLGRQELGRAEAVVDGVADEVVEGRRVAKEGRGLYRTLHDVRLLEDRFGGAESAEWGEELTGPRKSMRPLRPIVFM